MQITPNFLDNNLLKDSSFLSWYTRLPGPTKYQIFAMLQKDEQLRKNTRANIFPQPEDIFRALKTTSYDNTRAVILGQDPYHEEGQATGLAFSVPGEERLPPSLKNIYKVYERDLGLPMPESGDLTPWAKHGVLLLNTVLTVEEGKANSHKNMGWELITKEIIKLILQKPEPVAFLLWGKQAMDMVRKAKAEIEIPIDKKLFVVSSHPSPLSTNRKFGEYPAFMDSQPFSTVNWWMKTMGEPEIDWKI